MQFPVLLGRQTVLFQHIGRVAAVDILVVPGAEIGKEGSLVLYICNSNCCGVAFYMRSAISWLSAWLRLGS